MDGAITRSMLTRGICSAVLLLGCGGSPSSTPEVRSDTAAVLRAALQYLLEIDSSILLEPRLLPADSLNVLPPYSEPHAGLPASQLLIDVSAQLDGVTLLNPGPTAPDGATILSLSNATIGGDRTFVFTVQSSFDPRWGYSASFRRLRLEHDHTRGWRVVDAVFAGQEN